MGSRSYHLKYGRSPKPPEFVSCESFWDKSQANRFPMAWPRISSSSANSTCPGWRSVVALDRSRAERKKLHWAQSVRRSLGRLRRLAPSPGGCHAAEEGGTRRVGVGCSGVISQMSREFGLLKMPGFLLVSMLFLSDTFGRGFSREVLDMVLYAVFRAR